ncbi:MAG: hypothetical protein SWH61_03100 [Thermodesulfobacteriota bacterium]|nr:hypothetical protein [Thermodesulfobacteriota bacterium]
MKKRFHGIFSIVLLIATIAVGLYQVWIHSMAMGGLYILIILLAWPVMIYSYCAKCECRENGCRHVFVGGMTRLLPARQNTPYSAMDYLGLTVCLAAILGFPQYWLWQSPLMWIIFSVLPLLAGIEIWLFVCKGCGNTKCPICVQRNGAAIDRQIAP